MMGRTTKFSFGPGSLESVTLKIWTAKRDVGYGAQYKLSLKGTYMVYCGHGNEHTTSIDIVDGAWSTEKGMWAEDITAARDGDQDAAVRLAGTLVGWVLDDWSDSCDEVLADF